MHTKKPITTAELAEIKRLAMAISAEPIQDIEFHDSELEFDFDAIPLPAPTLAPVGSATGTQKVSIRIPAPVLAAFKARALATGKPYQALANQVLHAAAVGWRAA